MTTRRMACRTGAAALLLAVLAVEAAGQVDRFSGEPIALSSNFMYFTSTMSIASSMWRTSARGR